MQHLYYDIHEWGDMIERYITAQGLDIDNTSNNKQLRLTEIVYSFAANNSINVPEYERLIPELLPPYFKTLPEYLGAKHAKIGRFAQRERAEYDAFMARHNAEMALIAGDPDGGAAAIANVPIALPPVPEEALRVGNVPADDDDDDDNLDLPPLIDHPPLAPAQSRLIPPPSLSLRIRDLFK